MSAPSLAQADLAPTGLTAEMLGGHSDREMQRLTAGAVAASAEPRLKPPGLERTLGELVLRADVLRVRLTEQVPPSPPPAARPAGSSRLHGAQAVEDGT